MPVFEVYDDKSPRRIQADIKRVILGRIGDIAVDDRVVSRRHCEVLRSAKGYVLRDLGSRNGTRLNLEHIEKPTLIEDGDEITMGGALIKFWTNPAHGDQELPLIPIAASEKEHFGTAAGVKQVSRRSAPDRDEAGASQSAGRDARRAVSDEGSRKDKRDVRGRGSAAKRQPKQPEEAIPLRVPDEPEPPRKKARATVRASAPKDPGSLTIDDITPLNHEGKPAKAVDPQTGRVSESMFRLQELLLRGFQFRSTDIHVEPKEDHHQIRYRIDGTLHTLGKLENRLVKSIYSIIKLLCNLDINKRSVMQDGSFEVRLPSRKVQLRVSIAPSIAGDKMVLRVLDTTLAPGGLDSLHMDPYVLEQVRHKASQNSSMIIVCGPTGSGKTTTSYAIIKEMDALTRNIVTVEQPVEYKLEGVTQIEVSSDTSRGTKFDFSTALRSLLRQDPDVILVGEIRDADTARMAIQAAMTGHLMLSTLHARDSIGSIFRLLDLEVEPFLLASALTAVLSQRLMRRLCLGCQAKVRPSISQLSNYGLDALAGHDVYAPVGCDDCLGIGYRGRVPIFELLSITDPVRDAIANKPTIQQLRMAAGDWIHQTLRDDGIRKVRDGLTSVEEFARVAHQDS